MIVQKVAQTDMDLIPEIKNRWSPRAFADKEVEPEKLKLVLEAARWAPSSRNEQPWSFIIACKGEEHYEKLYAGLNEWNRKWAWTAPVVVAVLAAKKVEGRDILNTYGWHDVGLAMGNILAQATHEGLYVHQMAGIHPEVVVENFKVDPDSHDVVSMFVLGYQDKKRLSELEERYHAQEFEVRSRKSLDQFVFGEKFGENPDWL